MLQSACLAMFHNELLILIEPFVPIVLFSCEKIVRNKPNSNLFSEKSSSTNDF